MKKGSIIIFILVGLISFCSSVNAGNIVNYIVLDGPHKFSSGDNPAWSLPQYDDSTWQKITVPGSWQSHRIKSIKGMGWYRIYFIASDNFRNINPAILLGRIGDADEVFLNGVKIGSEGLIAERFVEATKVERLYKLPPGLIRYNDSNLLAVRVINTYLNGGIFDKNIIVGDYNSLLIEKFHRNQYVTVLEFCFFTFFAIFFITCFFFYIKGLRDREYIYFWVFISLYGILFILGSLTFYTTGLKTPLIQQTVIFISLLIPASLFLLVMNVYRVRLIPFFKAMLVIFPLIAFMATVLHSYPLKQYLYIIWKILFILTAAFLFFYAVRAYMRKFYESGPVLLGVSGQLAGFILESVGGLDLLQTTGFFLWDYSTGFFMICVMYALTARYMRIKELQSASVRIFKAHEDERKRLARELHDGIGTSLQAIKLRLQMLDAKIKDGAPVEKEAFPELISEITHSIDELRDVVMDLRPSFLENVDLADAITWHAKKVQERLGVQIKLVIDDAIKVSSRIKETIYRIYQEAISNAIKHSGATSVDVILKINGGFLSLEVKDNGKGFDPAHDKGKEKGIGLDTIKERAELLGGILKIRSFDKMGTSLYIEVPVE